MSRIVVAARVGTDMEAETVAESCSLERMESGSRESVTRGPGQMSTPGAGGMGSAWPVFKRFPFSCATWWPAFAGCASAPQQAA